MLKVNNKLTPSVKSTLIYLQSLLGEGEQAAIVIDGNEISIATSAKEAETPIVIFKGDTDTPINPIQHMLDHINDEMCSDCLKQDWQFKNPYFVDLVESYIDSLVHTYGLSVPIPYELARAILLHQIGDYRILGTSSRGSYYINQVEVVEKYKDWTFYLKVK